MQKSTKKSNSTSEKKKRTENQLRERRELMNRGRQSLDVSLKA